SGVCIQATELSGRAIKPSRLLTMCRVIMLESIVGRYRDTLNGMPVADDILQEIAWEPNQPPADLPRQERLRRIRHSASHVMAQAVREIFPEAKLAIGPPIENGFYYDMELSRPLREEDLPEIEKRMAKIAARDPQFFRAQIARPRAMDLFRAWQQPYKLELLAGIGDDQ